MTDSASKDVCEERPIPAWFRKEHAIRFLPDANFDFYSSDGETGIRQTGGPDTEFVEQEAAFLFGGSPNELFFRTSFSAVVKMDCSDDAEKAIWEKLFNMQTADFCDYSGPIAKTYHGIAVYRDALAMIPVDKPSGPDSPAEVSLPPEHPFLFMPPPESGDEEDCQGELFPEMDVAIEEKLRSSIDSEIQQSHSEVLGCGLMPGNEYYKYDIVFMLNRCFLIVHGDLSGDWLAEEDPFCDEPPLWFSEVSHRPSPVYQAQRCRDFFQKNIHGIPVFAMVVLPKNVFLLNEDDMGPVWRKQCSVYMVRTGKNPNSALPTLHDCLDALPEITETPSSTDLENLQGLVKRLERNPMEWEQA